MKVCPLLWFYLLSKIIWEVWHILKEQKKKKRNFELFQWKRKSPTLKEFLWMVCWRKKEEYIYWNDTIIVARGERLVFGNCPSRSWPIHPRQFVHLLQELIHHHSFLHVPQCHIFTWKAYKNTPWYKISWKFIISLFFFYKNI